MVRKRLLIGNWKLNHTRQSAASFFSEMLPHFPIPNTIDVAIAPVAPMLDFIGQKIAGFGISLAAQNVFYEERGAFTGEWSAEQLAELCVTYCIVGHSERRLIFYETDEDVSKKAKACIKAGITPVICLGEKAIERQDGRTPQVITKQVSIVLEALSSYKDCTLVFAYEPIWAIGTGNAATCSQVQEVHHLIRQVLGGILGKPAADRARIVYGGSVNAQNIKEIVSIPDVDGALVGGASLQVEPFLTMVEELQGMGLV